MNWIYLALKSTTSKIVAGTLSIGVIATAVAVPLTLGEKYTPTPREEFISTSKMVSFDYETQEWSKSNIEITREEIEDSKFNLILNFIESYYHSGTITIKWNSDYSDEYIDDIFVAEIEIHDLVKEEGDTFYFDHHQSIVAMNIQDEHETYSINDHIFDSKEQLLLSWGSTDEYYIETKEPIWSSDYSLASTYSSLTSVDWIEELSWIDSEFDTDHDDYIVKVGDEEYIWTFDEQNLVEMHS